MSEHWWEHPLWQRRQDGWVWTGYVQPFPQGSAPALAATINEAMTNPDVFGLTLALTLQNGEAVAVEFARFIVTVTDRGHVLFQDEQRALGLHLDLIGGVRVSAWQFPVGLVLKIDKRLLAVPAEGV